MSGLPEGSDAALAPIRAALREASRVSAAAIVDGAEAQASAILDDAKRQAELIRQAAVESGEQAARSEATLRSAGVRRRAHETVLRQQSALRLELQEQTRRAAVALRDDPRYPALLEALSRRCRELLGPETTVEESADGGIQGHAGSRMVDLSLPVIAAETLESMGSEVSALWAT